MTEREPTSTLYGAPSSPRLSSHAHAIRDELRGVAWFVASLWIVFVVEWLTPLDFTGLIPRRLSGLFGIVSMTFLHVNLGHLIGNTVPLFVLLTLLAGSQARTWRVVGLIILVGGAILWLIGRSAAHQGASLLIFGLIAFLISSGLLFERRPLPVAIAVIVGVMYGMTLVTGVIPHPFAARGVSWEGHLSGAAAGVIVAWLLTRRKSPTRAAIGQVDTVDSLLP